MAYRGKIGFHFPGRGNPNIDASNIKFLPAGITNPTSSDLVQVNKVYAIPAGVTITSVADLQNYIVWELVNSLVASNQTVVFEYIPSSDVNLTSIGIFTDSLDTNTTCNVAIYHESGLVVYRHNADTIDSTSTKYGLQGKRRHIDGITNIVLKAGLKYYIQYTQETDSVHTTIYPAYYDGSSGNYKVWYYGSVQNKQQANINDVTSYVGEISTTQYIGTYLPGTLFRWTGGYTFGLQTGCCYVRSNFDTGYTFTGMIGDADNFRDITDADVSAVLGRPINSDFIWYIGNETGMNRGDIYGKGSNWPSTVNTFDFTDDPNDWTGNLATIFKAIYDFNNINILAKSGYLQYDLKRGAIVSIKANYSSQVTSLTPLNSSTLPPAADRVTNGIYYLDSNAESGLHNKGLYHWNGSSWTGIDSNNLTTYLSWGNLSLWLTRLGSNSDMINGQYFDSNYQSDGLRSATLVTGRKYYLEINGNEV